MSQPEGQKALIISEFRASHGRVGGAFEGAPLLLLHTTGARSGQPRINPVMYLPDGGRYIVFASTAGADSNPGWYHNLKASPDARIEVGDRTLDVRAEGGPGSRARHPLSAPGRPLPGVRRLPAPDEQNHPGHGPLRTPRAGTARPLTM